MNPLQKAQAAEQLSQVWESYFPGLVVDTRHWRLLLDQYEESVITKAIQRCVKKDETLKGVFTLKQMLSFVESVCYTASPTTPSTHF